ncbi:MAG TPA: GntG family PLP-dependent aldolase, partial [Nitrospira sp.]|nr:GntG family PLP-dependent aldolase [Nitrospira sp.]
TLRKRKLLLVNESWTFVPRLVIVWTRMRIIDLRSDTVTKPTEAMREAMAKAEVGDDVYGEDPTVNRLQDMAAGLLGKKAALFVPSGTMANQLAIRIQTQPGQEVIAESKAHIVRYEQGAAGALAGVQLHWVVGDRGIMGPEQIEAAIRPKDPYSIQTALICLENTHNSGGGTIYPLATIERIRTLASAQHIPMHLDGARLFNAVAATTLPPAAYAQHFETVSVCLSKGLGAPAGSLLMTNDPALLEKARRFRRMYGGAMRQAGILAAAGIYALEHHVGRLKDDHDNAKRLARKLQQIPAIMINPQHVDTNIVIFDVIGHKLNPPAIVAALKQEGVLINAIGGTSFRAVTHLDVSTRQIDLAADAVARVLG